MTHSNEIHLTEEQMAELVAASPRQLYQVNRNANEDPALAAMQAHIAECPECSDEIAALRETLALFCDATNAYADCQLDHIPAFRPPTPRRSFAQVNYWAAAAAAAVLLAAFMPLKTHLRREQGVPAAAPAVAKAQLPAPPPESDEALLEDVTRQLSASVPGPMEALADPTGSAAASTNATQRTN